MNVLFDVYDSSGSLTVGDSDVTVNYNATRYMSSFATLNNGEISLRIPSSRLTPPDYYTILIRAGVSLDISSGTSRSQCKIYLEADTGSGYSTVPGTFCYTYNRTSGAGYSSAALMTTFHINKNLMTPIKFRVRAVRVTGSSTISTVANASSLIGIQDV